MFYETKNNFLNYKPNDDFDNYCSKFSRYINKLMRNKVVKVIYLE